MSPPPSSLPWRWKLRLLNLSAMLYFAGLTFGSLIIGVFITLPHLYRDDPGALRNRRLAAAYVFLNLLLNYTCLKLYSQRSRVRADSCRLPMAVEEGKGSGCCRTCNIPTPPRAKHCLLCNACVLKRDHHCFFGGCCVGFHNQRYFVAFCLHAVFGSLYSTLVTFAYLSSTYRNVLSSEFYAFLLPWLWWYLYKGEADIGTFALVIFGYFCVMTVFAAVFFFTTQCFLVVRGQTTYEYRKGIGKYRGSVCENVRSVFGPLWFLNLLVPLPFLKSQQNGMDWKVVHDFKQM